VCVCVCVFVFGGPAQVSTATRATVTSASAPQSALTIARERCSEPAALDHVLSDKARTTVTLALAVYCLSQFTGIFYIFYILFSTMRVR